MKENTFHRRLNKKLNNATRDNDDSNGDAHKLNKANREYGKAIIDTALEDNKQDEAIVKCRWCGENAAKPYSLDGIEGKFCGAECMDDYTFWEMNKTENKNNEEQNGK